MLVTTKQFLLEQESQNTRSLWAMISQRTLGGNRQKIWDICSETFETGPKEQSLNDSTVVLAQIAKLHSRAAGLLDLCHNYVKCQRLNEQYKKGIEYHI